jgi:type I restriction-modification system DNA methylase subunit
MVEIVDFRDKLRALAAKFEKDKTHYLSKGYPEAQVRVDFLNPFFEALGWDIENKAQMPPHERDVLVELYPETTGRPDYNFRINGETKFFVEAKAPSEDLDNIKHILQAKTYAWSTKSVFFVILTDFEEFKLFDASLKPNPKYPDEGLIYSFRYTDYLDNAEKLWELSKARVLEGALEALLPKDTRSKRLRIPPDKSFLEELTVWREKLAKDIYKRNPHFGVKLLNDVVQRLLDRIVFIRIAEDRRIRHDRGLWEIVALWKEQGKRKPIMSHLVDLFHQVNDDLNGDIFKRHACEKAVVDSALLADIIENLYFPKSRYRFNAIGVELLGSIYERYLGSTIRVTPKRAHVEEKPEVRKAGGVYYTPQYIVDYIVKNTVGKVIEGKSPKQIEKIRILDPACGSGSFLLGAYQYLIDYHLRWYREHPKERSTLHLIPYYAFSPDEFVLPLKEKAKILRNNIFGVDIDPQAVEITMMSLYLKALEGERGLLPRKQHLLPPLSENVKCGNSLIGYDIFDQGELFDDEASSRINPFDWNSKSTGFGEIMERGGFHVVIGNPPYVRQEMLGEFKDYFKNYYEVYHGTADLYAYFIEKGVSLLKEGGLFSYIVANKWMRANYGTPLRHWLKKQGVEEITDFGDLRVFENVTTYPCIMRIRKGSRARKFIAAQVKTLDFGNLTDYVREQGYSVKRSSLDDKGWSLVNEKAQELLDKLRQVGKPLGDYVEGKIFRGILTGLNEAFVIDKETRGRLINEDPKSAELIKPFLLGRDVKRYEPPVNSNRFLIFTRRGVDIKKYPAIHTYLSSFKKRLMPKPDNWKGDKWEGRKPGSYKWYEIQDTINYYEEFEKPTIIVPAIVNRASYAFDTDSAYSNDKTTIVVTDDLYLLALLNSKVVDFVMHSISSTKQGGYFEYKPMYLMHLPIRTIDFAKPDEEALHDKVVSLVKRMLDLHKKRAALPPCAERNKIEREIAVTDENIDDIVYELYGMTVEERQIIEESSKAM